MRVLLALACACAAFGGCRSTTAAPPDPPYSERHDAVWPYLKDKYDRDGDGVVKAAEYDRGEESFKRLDRDGDGAIGEADFRQAGGMDQFVAQMTMLRYFQADDARDDLKRGEVGAAFARHDGNGDGVMDEGEFTCAVDAIDAEGGDDAGPARRRPPGMNPYGSLLAMADGDGSRTLSLDELHGLFDARDDGDGVWTMRRRPPEGAAKPEAAPEPPPMTGVAEGERAPDFTLRSPDGARAATLSSFRGRRPVALIFGSYT